MLVNTLALLVMRIVWPQLLLFTLLLTACGTFKLGISPDNKAEPAREIVFHHFTAVNSQNGIIINELRKDLRPGKIKEAGSRISQYDFPAEIIFMNNSQLVLKKTYFEHPLIEVLEYADQNGELNKITRINDSVAFSIRYNHNTNIKHISFKAFEPDSLGFDFTLKIK